MINSQLPYNSLQTIRELKIKHDTVLNFRLESCIKSLYHLNGYLEAQSDLHVSQFLKLLEIVDHKYSFEMEGVSISLNRILEAYSSENQLKDKNAKMIFAAIDWKDEIEQLNTEQLKPIFLNALKKQGDFLREKKELKIQSYFTNLCLYTTPNNPALIQYLLNDLNQHLTQITPETHLLEMLKIHYQIRALSPYVSMNGHVARTVSKLFLSKIGMVYHDLPFSHVIFKDKEVYNTLMRELIRQDSINDWLLFMLEKLQESAEVLLNKIKAYLHLRKVFTDQMDKYTAYVLPSHLLLDVLFKKPYVKPQYICHALQCHRHTAYLYLEHLVKMGLLLEKTSGREKLYLNKALADLLSQ